MASKKLYELTVIRERIIASGRMIKWFAVELGYAHKSTDFYKVVDGRKVPNSHRRLLLSHMLDTKPDILWCISPNNGEVIAIKTIKRVRPREANVKPKRQMKSDNYIKVTKEMVTLMDRWVATYPLTQLATEIGVTMNHLQLPFRRYADGANAGIREGVANMMIERINDAIERREI